MLIIGLFLLRLPEFLTIIFFVRACILIYLALVLEMPWFFKKKAIPEKPPDYSASITYSLTLAAEKSLLDALGKFRQLSAYARTPSPEFQVTPGALVNLIKLNLGVLNKSLASRTMKADRVDWYSELVVEHKIPYNHPVLISQLYGLEDTKG